MLALTAKKLRWVCHMQMISHSRIEARVQSHLGALQVSRLAMLSLLAVFKDVLPGYRIRLPSKKELEVPVSKEVKQMRDYESMQLRFYQVGASMQICGFD